MTATPINDDELARVRTALDETEGDHGARFSRWVVAALVARVSEMQAQLAHAEQDIDLLDGELLDAQAELQRLCSEEAPRD